MKVCLIASQLLGYRKIGGFGSMTRQLATQLLDSGIDVCIVVPRRKGDALRHRMEGVRVHFLSRADAIRGDVFRMINADIYHSQHQSLLSLSAMRTQASKKHLVTCRDPRNLSDWFTEWRMATWRRKLKTPAAYLLEESPLAAAVLRRADLVAVPAYFLIPKVRKLYGLKYDPVFLPNIETIPQNIPPKSKKPTALWIGRFSVRKKPETFLQMAKELPGVSFHMIGRSEEVHRQSTLEKKMSQIPNLHYHGFLNKFSDEAFYRLLDTSWILVNTSAREGLPLTFIEAAGRGCALLGELDPDGFVSRFGRQVTGGDWSSSLTSLLLDEEWKRKGEKGYMYVKDVYAADMALKAHIQLYDSLLNPTG